MPSWCHGWLAPAGDDEYAEIVALLEEIAGPPSAAALAAFLAPTEAHLVDRALRVELRQVAEDLLLASVSTVGEREHVVACCGQQAWFNPRV
jgi:hypothetical protein